MTQESIPQLLMMAAQEVQAGELDCALARYQSVLACDPEHPVAWYGMGWIALQKGDAREAACCLRGAVSRAPQRASYHLALGLALSRAGDAERAIAAYRTCVLLQPDFAEAWHNLGNLLGDQGRIDQACDAYRRAIAANPASGASCRALGALLAAAGKPAEATVLLKRAIELNHGDSRAWCNLGLALEDMGRMDEAVAALRKARDLDPASTLIAYHLAALGGGPPPAACPPEYLVQLFERYAHRFDQHLVQDLQYRAPQLIYETIHRIAPLSKLEILDLGCGTGLCGLVLRKIASYLAGIDLSPGMIARARSRGIYDELLECDLLEGIERLNKPFDLFTAADLFIYVGDLTGIFQAASRWLRPGGYFAFTIESEEPGDYVVRRTRRYAHSRAYIRRLACESGLRELDCRPVTLRRSPDVAGYIFLLQKTAPSQR